MAKGFNLTAQLNIQGPNNLKPVISKLKTALDSVNGNINIKISGTSTKTIKGLTTALQSLSKASIQTNANLLTLSQTIGSLGSGLASLGGASSGVAGLGKVRSSVSSTKKAVVEATSALSDFGKQSGLALKRFAAFTAVSTAAFTLGAAIKSGFQEFVVFDKEIVRLAQVTGKSTKELGGITKEITRLSTGLGVASADLLQVTTTLAQAGLTAGETRIALEALAKSALAPSFDSLKETTEGSIAAMRQFGIQAGELEAALGSVNAVAAAFAVESSDIITAIQRTGGVFASSSKGVSQGTDALNEFIAVFTSIRATTRESAETIATGLRTIFTRIQRGDTIEALKEYGIVLTDLKGKFVGPYEATRRLSEGLKSLDPRDLKFSKIVEELGGFRQIGKVIPLIKEFASAEAALEVAYKGQSSLAKDAAIAQQSLAVQFTKTRESFVALIRDIGDSASFKLFITLGLGLANAFITLAGALKPLLPMLLTLATIKIGSSIGEYSRSFMSGFSGKPKGKSGGGVIGFARGGFVPGTGSGDTIPAMLEPGEFVIRKKAVDTLGASNLHRMNKSGGGRIQKFAAGGKLVVDYADSTPDKTQEEGIIGKHIANSVNALTNWYNKGIHGATPGQATSSSIQTMGQYFSVIGNIAEAAIKQLDNNTIAGDGGAFDLPQGFRGDGAKRLFGTIGGAKFPIDIKKRGEDKLISSLMAKTTTWYNKQSDIDQKNIEAKYKAGNLEVGAAIYENRRNEADKTIPFKLNLDRKDKEKIAKRQTEGLAPRTRTAAQKKWQGGMIQKFGPGGLLRGGFQYKGSSRDSVANYQTASHKLNSSLLKGNHDPNDPLVKDLDGAPKQIPPKSLYTGFGEGRFGSMSQQLKSELLSTEDISKVSGKNFALPGFLSTSTSVNQAKKFGNTGMLNISTKGQATAIDVEGTISPKDSKMRSLAADTSGLGSEREFILPRNAQMRLLSGSRSGSNQFLNLNVQELARGGGIQKFAGGTTGTGVKAPKVATAAEMYAAIKSSKLSVPNESMFGQFAGKELTDEIIRQVKRPPDASMSEEKREAYRNTGLFVQDAYDKDQAVIAAKLAERIQKSTKVALVGLLPFGHSKNTGPIDINGRDIMIYERGLDKQYEQAVLNMQAGSAGVANQFATDIQKAATIGGLKEYDFDDTLVTGAGVFDADGKIDVPGYKNIKRVEEALSRKTVALTPLGVDLKQQLESDPTALANIRIRTARPQSNAPALSKTLARLGLNIPATLITGLDGANKAVGLNPKATMVDDHAGNIEDVRKAGKKGIQYAPISALSQNTSMATGQANIEGAFIEQAMAMFGAPIIADAKATRAIDYPSGLGPAGSYFGLPPDWPAEVKRTIDSKSRATAIDEFTRYLFPKQVPVGKNLGGSIQKFAMGGASSDTVPAMLTPGEFVINKKAAKSIGYGKLNKMNHADSVEGFASGGPVGGVQYFADAGQVAAAAISTLPTAKQTYVNTVMGDGNKKLFEDQAQALLDMGHSAEEAGKKLLELASSTKEQKVLSNKAKKSWEDVGIKEDPELPIARQKNINIVAMAAASSILISKLQDLSATFAKSNSSIATGLGGLVTALEAGSSAVLSISVAKQIAIDNNPEIAKALKNPNSKASKALSFGTAAVVGVNAVGAGVSAVANKVLDTALAKNTKSLSDFDKSVQDLKDATDADAKSQARKKVQESFFALSKQINSSKDTIANAKSVKILADGAVTAGTALVTTATTLSMLLPLFKSLGSFFPALGAMGTGIALFVGGITAPVWGTIAAVVVGVGVALGALGYAFGFFEKSVVQVSPELTALAKAASAAAAANTALSLSSSEYNSQQLAAARIIKATAKNNGQSDESMRATFAQVELPEALKGNAQPNLANIYREEASGGFNINPVNVALIEHITDAIKTMNPNLDLAEKSLEDAIGMAGKTAKDAVKKGKDAYIESAYSKILNSDPSKNIDQLIGDRMFGGNTRQSTPENVALQNKLLALLKQRGMSTGNAGSVGRSLGYTPFTEEGKIKARKIVVESASNDANFIQVNGDLVKSGVKAVDVGLINLANTLKLFSSAIKKTTDDLASDISLVNEQTAMYFGEGKIEAQKYAKEISVLSNPSAATPDEIEGAYKAVRQNFSTGATPAVEEVMNRMESNTKALSSAEQQLPALIKAINRDYGEGRNDAMRRIADQMTATVATAGGLSPSSPQMREYNNGVSQALNITTDAMSEESLNTFSKAYGDATASMVKSTEVAKESLELLGKSGQLIADQQNSIVSKSLKNLELGFTKFNINNQFAIEKMRLFGESVSLDMLNAPIDNQLKTLTGGMTDPTSIAATYAQKSIEAQRAAETGADLLAVQALQTEADRFKQALDLLATNTDRAQNAMGKAAERLNELKSKRNLLESMLTGGAAKRSEMREFNNALVRLNKGDRGRLQTDIPLILKNIGMLGEKQQESIRARFAEMPEFSDPAVRGALNPKTDASLQESLAQAAKDVAVQTEAIALKIALNDTGIKTLTESIVDLTKAVNAENKRKTAQIEGKTAKTLTEITAPRTTTPQDQSSMKQNPISLIGDSGGLIKKFGADMEKEYKGWWTSLGTEDNDSMTRSRSMLSSKAFQNPEDGGVGLAVYDPTTEKGFAYLKLQIQTLQAAITANNSESGPISSMGPLMTKTLIDLIDRLTAATGARARGISDGQLRISTAPGPRFQPNQDAVDLTGGGAFSIPPEPVRSRTFPKTQTPPPIAPSPAMPINTTPLNNTTSNTTLYSPLVSALTSLVSVMKTYQETMAPTTDTTSPTTNSPLDGMVKVFDGAVLAFGNVVQDLAQVKIKTQSNVNLVTELVISGQTDLSPDSIDLIRQAYEKNTNEMIAKNTRNLETFG